MMLDARASQTSYISQVLLIGVENCIVRFDCRRNRLWYTPLANQKTPQAPHCIGDPSRMMAKKLPALLQLLRRQKGEAARSPATEISLDCCASKDVTLASEKPVSLLDLESRGFCSCGQAEYRHLMSVLPVCDEFRESSTLEETKRKSGSVWRSAWATTSSDGGMPGRMVRSQDPNELHTSLGATTARYCSSPCTITAA